MDTSIIPFEKAREYADAAISEIRNRLEKLPPAEQERIIYGNMSDEEFEKWLYGHGICSPNIHESIPCDVVPLLIDNAISELPPAQQDENKYEYHYDHTDCIWYRPEARNRCPATCAQYRDGWNDAMNYIFRDGEGYRPFRRDKKYEG